MSINTKEEELRMYTKEELETNIKYKPHHPLRTFWCSMLCVIERKEDENRVN